MASFWLTSVLSALSLGALYVSAFDNSRSDNVRPSLRSECDFMLLTIITACSVRIACFDLASICRLHRSTSFRYWGQNSYGATHSDTANFQKSIATYCQVTHYSYQTLVHVLMHRLSGRFDRRVAHCVPERILRRRE